MFTGICILFITVQTLQLANGASTKKHNMRDPNPIKYPGPIQELSNRYGTSDDSNKIPDGCKGKQFCTVKPADYPQEKFNKMFKGYKPIGQPTLILDDTFGNRQGDPMEADGCETIITYEPIYQVRAKEGDWRTVVQAPEEDFVQRVRLEECKDTTSKCFTVFNNDIGIETFCKQKYNVWEILVATANNGTEKIKTELPVCCSCHYRLN